MPLPEECNAIDDDCDGTIDEEADRLCSSACGLGVQICSNGALGACTAPQPSTETCANGFDEDCDGFIDEGC